LEEAAIKTASENDFQITWEPQGIQQRARLSGRINVDSSPEFRASLLQMLTNQGCQSLIVDFYEVVYIDTSGLAVLIEVLRSSRQLGKGLRLSGLRDRPLYFFESTGVLNLFDHELATTDAK
jgi:anti-anti-sigma factor